MDDVTMSDLYAIIAERDAEIAALRDELAGVIVGHSAAVGIWGKRDYDQHAEIAALKAELAEWQVKSGMYEHSFDEALKDVSYMEADIKALRAQVAELEAWKAAVPVATLRVYVDKTNRIKNEMYSRQYLYEDFLTDRYVIDQWLATFDAMAPD